MAYVFQVPFLKTDAILSYAPRPRGSNFLECAVEERDIHLWLGRLYVCLERPGWQNRRVANEPGRNPSN